MIRRRVYNKLKGIAMCSWRLYYNKVKDMKKDKILRKFIMDKKNESFFDDNGDLVIIDSNQLDRYENVYPNRENHLFFDVRASFEKQLKYKITDKKGRDND